MIEELQNLLLLQAIDFQIRDEETSIKEIPIEIENLIQNKKDQENRISSLKNELDEQHKLQRKLELDLQGNESRLTKFNVQLNQLKSNNDYKAMLKQIETIKSQNGEIENAILETFEEIDQYKIDLKKIKKDVAQKIEEISVAIKNKEAELQEHQKKYNVIVEERSEIELSLPKNLLKHYGNLLSINRIPAVSFIVGETCSGCHLTIRPNTIIEIKRNDAINYCENCNRFIYWKET